MGPAEIEQGLSLGEGEGLREREKEPSKDCQGWGEKGGRVGKGVL